MTSAKQHPHKTIEVLDKNMSYVELGDKTNPPMVFLHGNPTSSYLWRNIMPQLQDKFWCLAPDLIGMGNSDKLDDNDYRFVAHREYLDGWFDCLGLKSNITLVIHDWGSALGFDFANRNRDAVKAICYMEGIVCPIESWDEWPEAARQVFQGFRSTEGEDMILEKNIFIENVLPGSIIRDLTREEMAIYRSPFEAEGEGRRPTLTWPREIPIGGAPSDVVEIVAAYAKYMSENDMPKLFINATPGAILTGAVREFCRKWKNQTEVSVKGSHFIQEDSPDEIAAEIKKWAS